MHKNDVIPPLHFKMCQKMNVKDRKIQRKMITATVHLNSVPY